MKRNEQNLVAFALSFCYTLREMKKTFKNIFGCLIVAVVLILLMPIFCGGNSSANASNFRGEYISICYSTTKEGYIKWELDVGLNSENRGLADDNEKQTYRMNVRIFVQELFEKQYEEYLTIFNANPIEQYRPEVAIVKKGNPMHDVQGDFVGYSFQFASVGAFNFYHNQNTTDVKVSDNLFLSKQVKREVFPFAKIVETANGEVMFANYLKKKMIASCEGLSNESQMLVYNPEFIYDYQTSTNRIKSNADLKYTDATGRFHHAWGKRLNEITQESEVEISLVQPHRGWWYVFGGGIPLVVMAIAILIVVIKNKKTSKQKEKIKEIIINSQEDCDKNENTAD